MKLPCTGRVKVRMTYLGEHGAMVEGPTERPYKWEGVCTCGWRTLSWSWSRQWDCYTVNAHDPAQWIEDNGGPPYGGTMVNALEHVGLATDPNTYWA